MPSDPNRAILFSGHPAKLRALQAVSNCLATAETIVLAYRAATDEAPFKMDGRYGLLKYLPEFYRSAYVILVDSSTSPNPENLTRDTFVQHSGGVFSS